MTYKLIIPNWHPASKNKLTKGKLRVRMHLEKIDRNIICGYCLANRVPLAQGPREVNLTIDLGPKRQAKGSDPDAYWMSLLDSLVAARMLIDDRRQFCRPGRVEFERGAERATTIELVDLY